MVLAAIFPKDISTDGKAVDELFYWATALTGIAFAAVALILAICIVVFPAWRGRKARYIRGDSLPAVVMMVVLSLLVFFGIDVTLALKDSAAYKAMYVKEKAPANAEKPLIIHVIGKQYEWNFRYPGADGEFDAEDDPTPDDFTTTNLLVVPKGRPVMLRMRSFDVIHSLFLPNLRRKQDVVPGLTVSVAFVAKDPGIYENGIACAEMCGTNHGTMVGTLKVMVKEGEDGFDQWFSDRSEDAANEMKPEIWEKWPVVDKKAGK